MSLRNIELIVVITARNEEKHIGATLEYLAKQSISPKLTVVVNDGSVDKTNEIASKFDCIVINLPLRDKSALNTNALADVYNFGFEYATKKISAYTNVLVVDADTLLPPRYIETLILEMNRENLDMVGGVVRGEEQTKNIRGTGRIMSRKLFEIVNRQYPKGPGWDGYPSLKALQLGLKSKVLKKVKMEVTRPTSTNYSKSRFIQVGGRLRAYGYPLIYVFQYLIIQSGRNKKPRFFIDGVIGYFQEKYRYEQDLRKFIRYYQYKNLLSKLRLTKVTN